nr:hypothetical protein [Candidatus Freyarchaeota archaeon]
MSKKEKPFRIVKNCKADAKILLALSSILSRDLKMRENLSGVIVKYHPCTPYARGSDCPYYEGGRHCGKEPLKCEMPEYDQWYKSLIKGKMKCFYPNRISLLENPGVPMFLYHTDFHAIMGEAIIKRGEVRDGEYFYFFDAFIKYPYPVLLEIITTDERIPKMARAGRWSHVYISRETIDEIRSLSKMPDEMKVKLGIDLEKVISELRKKPAMRKPDWRIFMEGEIKRLQDNALFDKQVLERTSGYFSEAASKNIIKGRSKEEIFYALLYLALRMLETPIRLSDIGRISNINSSKILKNYSLLVSELNLSPPPINPVKIVSYYAKELKIKKRTFSRATSIIKSAKREGATSGSDPFSSAATATYLACIAENEKVTQDEIGKVFGVTAVTIRNNTKKLNKFVKVE